MRNTSSVSKIDCQVFLTKVLESPRGARAKFPTKGAAVNFRQRCYIFISNERKASVKVYEESHPLHGKTIFDAIVLQTPVEEEGKWVLYGFHTQEGASDRLEIESL